MVPRERTALGERPPCTPLGRFPLSQICSCEKVVIRCGNKDASHRKTTDSTEVFCSEATSSQARNPEDVGRVRTLSSPSRGY